MVVLYVKDLDQLSLLEFALINAGIEYERELANGKFGLATPFLTVCGTPLDEKHAMDWIIEQICQK
jgi:hypothetical protein